MMFVKGIGEILLQRIFNVPIFAHVFSIDPRSSISLLAATTKIFVMAVVDLSPSKLSVQAYSFLIKKTKKKQRKL